MKNLIKIFVIFCVVFAVELVPIPDDLIVSLPNGKVQGATYVTSNNKTYYGFRGIPFAIPPIGELRFEPPQPAKSWSGIWNATTDGKSCISKYYVNQKDVESEDCLYINVYIPANKSTEKLPVMFWIYGGAYINGDSTKDRYGPDFLVEEDVIVVTSNYRLGSFGFLATADQALPGNMGLKDQNLALKWTNENIEYFGGNPKKITIFGQSAGGTSVGLHLVSKMSTGLFSSAIVESGSALVTWSIISDPRTRAFTMAKAIPGGNYRNDSQALKEFLKSRTIEEIVTATATLTDGILPAPNIEPKSETAFLTNSSYVLMDSGEFNRVPIVIGICAEESIMFLKNLQEATQMAISYDSKPTTLIPTDLRPKDEEKMEVIKKIQKTYLKGEKKFENNLIAFSDFISDTTFTRGVLKHAEITSNYVSVYLYQFAYFGRAPVPPFINGGEKAGHAAELPFIFNKKGQSNTTDPADLLTQKRMSTLWANFAKFGNPTPTVSDLFQNITWPLLNNKTRQYLNINGTLNVRTHLKENSYPKWNEIYENYGTKPFVTF